MQHRLVPALAVVLAISATTATTAAEQMVCRDATIISELIQAGSFDRDQGAQKMLGSCHIGDLIRVYAPDVAVFCNLSKPIAPAGAGLTLCTLTQPRQVRN